MAYDGALLGELSKKQARLALLDYVLALPSDGYLPIPILIQRMLGSLVFTFTGLELECAVRDLVSKELLLVRNGLLVPAARFSMSEVNPVEAIERASLADSIY